MAVGEVIAAFSMWQAKDQRNIKLQTFIVGQTYRGTAIGQHLLYHELRTWAHPQGSILQASALADRLEASISFRENLRASIDHRLL